MVVTVINMRNSAQGERNDSKSTIPAWDATCLSQKRSGGLYCQNMHLPVFNMFDIGATQASIRFKNDCKISQRSAEFEMHAIDSLNYSLLIPI